MTRVTSRRTRQAILVVGEHTDPFILPEKLELFDELGQGVDLANDRSRLRWAGIWRADLVYDVNDLVYHEGFLWVAPDEIGLGIEPGVGYANPAVEISRGVQFYQSDRLNSVVDVPYTIGPPPGQRRDNDISAGYSAAILIDKAGVTSGLVLIVTPVSDAPTGMTVDTFSTGNGLDQVVNWNSAEIDAHTPKSIPIPDGATADRFCHVFFDSGQDGSFYARISNAANVLASPIAGAEWDPVVAQLPPGGADGQQLVKASATDYDIAWEDPPAIAHDLPVGGTAGQVLAKINSTDRNVTWVNQTVDPSTVARRTAAKTTASLTAAADTGSVDTRLAGGGESGTWVLGDGMLLSKIVVDRPSRVRLYTTSAKRTADVARDRFTDPSGDHGCLAEFLLISSLSLENIPADYLFSGAGDNNIYYRIENYDLSAGTVTVTLTVKDVEL